MATMKKLLLLIALVFLLSLQSTFAQSRTIAKSAPLVDPVTQCALRYYYYPNLQAYFDTNSKKFFFKENGKWVTADLIPEGYGGYSVYRMLSVMIKDYDDDNPTQFLNTHKKLYPYTSNGRIKPRPISKK